MEPQWFGRESGRVFGWLHEPDAGAPRAAVVLCPSMGQEYAFAHYTLRKLAVDLAGLGFLVIRFDYEGTGDSSGESNAPGRWDAWMGSVEDAIHLVRRRTGAPLVLLGLRVGALLAVAAAGRRDDVDALVLWDSPRSGASYIREQRTRQSIALGDLAPTDSFTGVGLSFSGETLAELRAIDLRTLSELPCTQALTVTRSTRSALDRDLRTRTGSAATHLHAPDQDELLYRQTLPLETEQGVLSWIDAAYPGEAGSTAHPAAPATEAGDVHPGPTQDLVLSGSVETILELGPHGLFGIHSEPLHRVSSTTVVFVPEFFTPHSGLMRAWTELARDWAQHGIATLRFDVSGCGDSPPRPGLEGHRSGIVEHLDDVHDAVVHLLGDDAPDSLLVGLCSGGYLAAETALRLRALGVALINPVFSFITPENPVSTRRQALAHTRTSLNRVLGRLAGRLAVRLVRPDNSPMLTRDPAFDWNRSFEAGYWRNLLHRRVPRLPEWVWFVLTRFAFDRLPHQVLSRMVRQGTDVLFVAGDPEWDYTWLGSRRAGRTLGAKKAVDLRHLPELDHAMLRPGMKQLVSQILTEHICRLLLREPPGHPDVASCTSHDGTGAGATNRR